MRVVITGGGGMLGQKLARALAGSGGIGDRAIDTLALADVKKPPAVTAPFKVTCHKVDITDRSALDALFADGADVIFHLAAIVSGESETNFDLGMSVNLIGSINVFEAARRCGNCPIVVFTSSIAVYGGEIPAMIEDWTILNPQTSYGAEKAAAELLLTDYSRRGFLDGRGPRLPTISVRPGKANLAASSFMSSIFREPLQGQEAVCPVGPEYEHWYLSPRRCIENLIHAAELPGDAFGQNRCFALPGKTHAIGDMVDAMGRIAGEEPVKLIRWEPDAAIQKIVLGWRAYFNPAKALALGFVADESFEDNIRFFLEDDIEKPGASTA
ncbi:MAG: SDR family oxidoreductase [Paracoccaceae bacterium]|nr:SDR family oxidoreductase [Paracoccaceae bacterium]